MSQQEIRNVGFRDLVLGNQVLGENSGINCFALEGKGDHHHPEEIER